MARKKDSSPSSKLKHRTPRQEAFEREAREKLEHADMDAFDRFMKRLVSQQDENKDGKGGQRSAKARFDTRRDNG